MANFLKGIEEKATLVLANVCIAFVVLAKYSPETSRLYLMITATALGLLSLYPLFLILQRPRRFMVARETEGDKSVFILRYKGFLWWYNAKDRKGEDVVFNTMDEAQRYIRENVVTVLISDRMRRKSFKKEYEVILDSKKMAANTDAPPADDNQQQQDSSPTDNNQHVRQQQQDSPSTPQQDGTEQDAQQHEEYEREEIIPDNAAAIAGLLAMGKESQDEDDDKEDEGKEKRSKDAEPNQNKGTETPKQQLSGPTAENAPPESGTEIMKQQQDGDMKKEEKEKEEEEDQDYLNDPFDSRYPAPKDDADGDDNPHGDSPEDGQDNDLDGQVDAIDAETFNQRLFDVIDNFNKSANHRKAVPKPEKQPPATKEETLETEPPKPYVTTAQVYEEQALVHAHKAETVKDALSKILFHQQMMERNKEREKEKEREKQKENKPAPAPTPTHQKAQAIPKSKRRKHKSPDGIPTKNIQYRPSSEELLLRRRQLSLLEVPGFVDPEEEDKTDTTKQPDARQPVPETAQDQPEPETATAGNDDSSGGPKVVKRLEGAGNETASPAVEADMKPVPDNTMTETPNVVFINGSEDKAEEPPDNENATLPL